MIRVAIIGVGHWHTPRHVDALRLAEAIIIGVSERDALVAERWGRALDCPWFDDAGELLDRTQPDFVFALPRHVDAPAVARNLIERNLPFAIEKPLGVRADEIEPLIGLARARNAYVAVPFVNRYGAFWEELERLRGEGALGELAHAHFRVINGPPARYIADGVAWVLDPALSGGGALRNIGAHTIDAFLTLTGEPVEIMAATTSSQRYHLPVEEYASATLLTPSGVIGTIEAGYTRPDETGSDQEWRVAGRGAYLIARDGSLLTATVAGEVTRATTQVADHYTRFARDTLERWRQGLPPIASVEDCWRVAQVTDRIYAVAGGQASSALVGAGRE